MSLLWKVAFICALFFPVFTQAAVQCPNLTRNLSVGSRGNDVVQLQQFFISQNLLTAGNDTGYFGRLTQSAVQKFQCKHLTICSGSPSLNGYGAVGPRTRASISSLCVFGIVPSSQPQPAFTQPSTLPAQSIAAPPTQNICTPLASQTQNLTCPPGQTGAIVQLRSSTCPGPVWSNWQTVSNTCTVSATQSSCAPLQPQTQTLSCPTGQTGSITQTRTSSCSTGAVNPLWGEWQITANTCTVPVQAYSLTNLRGGDNVVFSRRLAGTNPTYNYDPSIIYDNGMYRMYWCGGYAGDFILYAESNNLSGPWHSRNSQEANTYDTALMPTFASGDFDGQHTCNPSVIKVGSNYYLYYTGSAIGSPTGKIGIAQSSDGYTFSRLNSGQPIISPANKISGSSTYGAGTQSVTYANGKYYMTYIDSTGKDSNPINAAGEYLIRASDPLFTQNAETFTGTQWVSLSETTATEHAIYNGINMDLAYIPEWQNFLALSHSDANLTHAILFDMDFKKLTDQLISPTQWCDGPGLVTNASRNAILKSSTLLSLDFLRAVGNCSDPFTWDLSWRGADLFKSQ